MDCFKLKYRTFKYSIFIITVWLSCCFCAFAQDAKLSNLRETQINLTSEIDTIQFDSQSVSEFHFQILDTKLDSSFYKIDFGQALFIELKPISFDLLTLKYRVLPFSAYETVMGIKEYEKKETDTLGQIISIATNDFEADTKFGNLSVQGGLGRSLNFGNSQNLVVNSNLNLRLSGELQNGVQVLGVLTDENVPFQPQGNSRQIRELDKVFLQFKKDKHVVTLGDYEQRKPQSYFLTFNKRLQGANYTGTVLEKGNWKAKTSVSGAVSRGKYTQNQFTGKEGNQGPYKLIGGNNESFLVILAGTEQVFIDGMKMERGEDQDYVIDYNIGEIVFTSRQFITNRSRISVEFEYVDQIYNNTFLHTESTIENEKVSFRLNLFSEQDSKTKANLGDTTLNAKNIFNQLGDQVDEFFIPSYREAVQSDDRIQYRLKRDTTVNTIRYDSIFVQSSSRTEQLYQVGFTYVGQGKGNYKIKEQLLNGRAYEWAAPVNGLPQGDYIAKLRVIPPKSRQMISLVTDYKLNDNQTIQLENAFSNQDLNTLSKIGNEDNQGFASFLTWKSNYQLSKKDTTKNRLKTKLNFELKNAQFRSIDRYRSVEFSRDWNLSNEVNDSLQEYYGKFSIDFLPNKFQRLNYQASTFIQDEKYNGLKNEVSYSFENNGYRLNAQADYLSADETLVESHFFRPSFSISKQFDKLKGIRLGVSGQENKREFKQKENNLLDARSIGDKGFRFFFETQDTSLISTKVSFGRQFDYTPDKDALSQIFQANVIEAEGSLNKLKNQNLIWNFTFRDLEVVNSSLTQEKNRLSFLGRANYNGRFFKGLLKTGFDFEVGSGQEPKREFTYVKVAAGQGRYTWIDYNKNGEQEITEFEIAPFTDQAEYVRVFTSSNEYINANTNRLKQWVIFEPMSVWRDKKGIRKTLSRFSSNSNLTLNRKLFETSKTSQFNPYVFDIEEDGLLSASNRLINRVVYNKLSNKFRLTYLNEKNDQKSQLLSGFEKRNDIQNRVLADIYFKNKLSLNTQILQEHHIFSSENYKAKNFDFERFTIKPKLNYVLNTQLRLGVDYAISLSENQKDLGGEKAQNNAVNLDFNWNKKKLFAIKGKLNYNDVNYQGNQDSAVKFSMLNGLQAGRNIIWNLNFEREVAKSVKVNLIYDGRQLGVFEPVHTGRARVTAMFN